MITGQTSVFWLLGHPVKQTVSPGLFNRAFAQAGHDAVMTALDVPPAQLAKALQLFRSTLNVQGCLLTIPHKHAATACMDAFSERSLALGLVNIVRRTSKGLEGDALDGQGFLGALSLHRQAVAGQRALIIGCGGAGAASAWDALADGAACVGLLDTDTKRRESLVRLLSNRFGARRVQSILQVNDPWHIVLNASPLGMYAGDALPMALNDLPPGALLIDATTPAQPSAWLSQANARGHRVIHGQDFTRGQVLAMAEFFGLPASICLSLKSLTNQPQAQP
jgi:shikimate dehydrogenase